MDLEGLGVASASGFRFSHLDRDQRFGLIQGFGDFQQACSA